VAVTIPTGLSLLLPLWVRMIASSILPACMWSSNSESASSTVAVRPITTYESLLQDSLPIGKLGSEPTSHRLGGQQSRQGVARSNRYLGERAIVQLLCGNSYTDPIIDNDQGCVEITPASTLFFPAVPESDMTVLSEDWKKFLQGRPGDAFSPCIKNRYSLT
jgi:hypothetical protein